MPATETVPTHALTRYGSLYLAGVKKHSNVTELWTDDGSVPECFRVTMSDRRSYTLLRTLRLDDCRQRKELDNLAPIRNQFEEFVKQCKCRLANLLQ
ncbi:hypothetical protein Trydic_g16533 [Trypoxylus dichotomus]